MSTFQRVMLTVALVAPLALGACTTARTSGTVSSDEPSALGAGARTTTDTQQGDTFVLPPEPGFNPDGIVEAP